jgi:hypothetical protein
LNDLQEHTMSTSFQPPRGCWPPHWQACLPAMARAQTDKPLRIVVPFGPGGSDTLARHGRKLSELKQP